MRDTLDSLSAEQEPRILFGGQASRRIFAVSLTIAQHQEPLKCTLLPNRTWQKIAADLCELDGKHFLVIIDYFSRFIEIAFLQSITSVQVIEKMTSMFARWGIPEEMVSDNGTQFTSEAFQDFATDYKFRQTFSSSHYPQSNGEVEIAVKIVKGILRQEDIFKALLSYRNTQIEATGQSPAELMMGQKLRTTHRGFLSILFSISYTHII
jgi:transposase InsO family protein